MPGLWAVSCVGSFLPGLWACVFLVVCVVRAVACSYILRGGAVRFFFAWLWLRSLVSCILWLGVALLVINS